MSFGGIGNILSQIGGMALTPAMETYIQDYLGKSLMDADLLKDLDPEKREMLSNIAGGTLGTVLGTGLNAGLGYLTGGKEGAAAGAMEGLIMSGGAALQHDKFKEAMGMGDKTATTKPAPGTAIASTYGTNEDPTKITGPEAWSKQAKQAVPTIGMSVDEPESTKLPEALEIEDTTKPETSAGEKKPGYFELAGQLGMPAWGLGMGLGSSMATARKRQEEERERLYRQAIQQQRLNDLFGSLYHKPYAEGGGVTVSSDVGAPTSVTFPDWFIEELANTGGLSGYATGGYINTEQMNPDATYPQSMIPRAQPYPGAAPIRHEVVNMERGGLLEGEGDGMSDHIPANIDGKEKVRVADGEFVVPADIAKRYGEDRLHAMMNKVRSAAHAKKGKQIVENAGKRAFIQTMSKVKA